MTSPTVSGTGFHGTPSGIDNTVRGNKVWGNRPSKGGTFNPAGIMLHTAKGLTGGGVETGNKVVGNQAYHNHEVDISWDQKGNNTFKKNKCDFSDPGGLCH